MYYPKELSYDLPIKMRNIQEFSRGSKNKKKVEFISSPKSGWEMLL